MTRKVVFIGYSYRWMRGLDYNLMDEELLERCSPIRRQLLGDGNDIKGWWQPTEEDVPLKGWLAAHRAGGSQLEEGLSSDLIFGPAVTTPSPGLPDRRVARM